VLQYPTKTRGIKERILPLPTFVFALIVATLLGVLVHVVVGGDARRLALLLVAGWAGFAFGHIFGVAFHVELLNVGTLRLLSAILGACFTLVFAALVTSSVRLKRII
jgi:hypothetical protein